MRRLLGPPRPALKTAAGLVVVVALIAAGCGGSSSGPPAGTGVGVGITSGPPVSLFNCNDWENADPQTRFSTVARIRDFVGGQVTGAAANGSGNVLDDEDAYNFFEQYCDQQLAGHFLLYKLYGRAAGFAGHPPDE